LENNARLRRCQAQIISKLLNGNTTKTSFEVQNSAIDGILGKIPAKEIYKTIQTHFKDGCTRASLPPESLELFKETYEVFKNPAKLKKAFNQKFEQLHQIKEQLLLSETWRPINDQVALSQILTNLAKCVNRYMFYWIELPREAENELRICRSCDKRIP